MEYQLSNQLPQIYLDCDGVLADFDKRAIEIMGMGAREFEKIHGAGKMWGRIYREPEFFFSLEKMADTDRLVKAIVDYGITPKILTGLPSGGMAEAESQKRRWGAKHFPGIEMITCMSRDKRKYCTPGDIIIDDWPKHQLKWESTGGIWILHNSVSESLMKLHQHMDTLTC
jgi:hypothetical protein